MKTNQNKRIILNKNYIHELKALLNMSSHHVNAIFASDCANHIKERFMQDLLHVSATDAISAPHLWISQELSIIEARVIAQKVHLQARNEDHSALKYFYRACGHAAASVHVKTHAIHASNYAIKSLLSNSNLEIDDIEETERNWQIKHLLDLGLKA